MAIVGAYCKIARASGCLHSNSDMVDPVVEEGHLRCEVDIVMHFESLGLLFENRKLQWAWRCDWAQRRPEHAFSAVVVFQNNY